MHKKDLSQTTLALMALAAFLLSVFMWAVIISAAAGDTNLNVALAVTVFAVSVLLLGYWSMFEESFREVWLLETSLGFGGSFIALHIALVVALALPLGGFAYVMASKRQHGMI
jgi:hypothetical protein